MDNEKQEEKQEEKKVVTIQGRAKPKKKRRSNSKQLVIKDSAQAFESEFYIYLVDPTIDLDKYVDASDENGIVDIDKIDDEDVIEFRCRYVDPGTLQELARSPLAVDMPESADLSDEEMARLYKKMVFENVMDQNKEQEMKYKVLHACILEPQFENPEQVKRILPQGYVEELFYNITQFAYGGNIRSRFRGSNKRG